MWNPVFLFFGGIEFVLFFCMLVRKSNLEDRIDGHFNNLNELLEYSKKLRYDFLVCICPLIFIICLFCVRGFFSFVICVAIQTIALYFLVNRKMLNGISDMNYKDCCEKLFSDDVNNKLQLAEKLNCDIEKGNLICFAKGRYFMYPSAIVLIKSGYMGWPLIILPDEIQYSLYKVTTRHHDEGRYTNYEVSLYDGYDDLIKTVSLPSDYDANIFMDNLQKHFGVKFKYSNLR